MFFFASIASVAFASCTNDENIFEGVKNGREMTFVAADYVHQTRGEHDWGAFTNANYQVWAWVDSTDNAHISGLEVAKNGTYIGDYAGKTYYWPDEALDFAAISPANDPRIKVARTAGGATTVTYKFDASHGNEQINLMHADFVDAQKKTTPTVALGFRHALAKLNVVVQQTQDPKPGAPEGTSDVKGYEVIVKKLSINGFHTQGQYVVSNNTQNTKDNVWTIATPGDTTNWNIITSATSLVEDITSFTSKPHTAKYGTNGYVMPQALADSVKVNFDYDIVTVFKSGATSRINKTHQVNLNSITNGSNPIKNWYTNKNITYTFTINPKHALTAIEFNAKEEEWGPTDGSDIF